MEAPGHSGGGEVRGNGSESNGTNRRTAAVEGRPSVLVPELLYVDGAFQTGQAVELDPASGRILAVGPADQLLDQSAIVHLPGRALLPGFVNAHSHAFQRLIRGRTQWRPVSSEADFWSWREAMYRAVRTLSPEDVQSVSRFCFLEMLRAGFTTVGEFHYLHNDPQGNRYDDSNELADRVLAAASEVGIRIVLLNGCYAAGGIGEPPGPEQARFATPDLDEFLVDTERLVAETSGAPLAGVGLSPHSVRAVPRAWLRPVAEFAASQKLPLHMHLSEQPGEVAACRKAFGVGPVELAATEGLLGPEFTGIHVTHPAASEIQMLGDAEATVCLCPTTECDLGDGIPPALELLEAGVGFALGTDSHTQLAPFVEMRLVEYHERLRTLQRVVLADRTHAGKTPEAGDGEERLTVASRLLGFATEGGAHSLGLEAGRIGQGALADFLAVDLAHPALAGWRREELPELLVFSAPPDVVTDVWVGGIRRIEGRRHPLEDEAAEAFCKVAVRAPES